jgi:hypothetical protein
MVDFEFSISVNGRNYSSITAASDAIGRDLDRAVNAGLTQVSVELRKALDMLFAELAAKHGSPWPNGGGAFGTAPDRLSLRSGRGLRSIKDSIKVTQQPGEVVGQISTGALTVHETGATITAKNARYLTIPLRAALDGRGVPLRSRARDWDDTFIARTPGGALLIFRKETGGTITPLYLLKKSVRIPKRLGMTEAFDRMVPYFQAKAIAALEKALADG